MQAEALTIVMPAGTNGKLYGAVTSQTVMELLQKQGYDIERKRIEIPGAAIKSTGKYTVTVRLYEANTAELTVLVKSQEQAAKEAEEKAAEPKAEAAEPAKAE